MKHQSDFGVGGCDWSAASDFQQKVRRICLACAGNLGPHFWVFGLRTLEIINVKTGHPTHFMFISHLRCRHYTAQTQHEEIHYLPSFPSFQLSTSVSFHLEMCFLQENLRGWVCYSVTTAIEMLMFYFSPTLIWKYEEIVCCFG